MTFPAYPDYKDSGVEWLGNVPSHWRVGKVKHFYSFKTGWTPPSGNDKYYGGEHLWANISDLGSKWITTTSKTITDKAIEEFKLKPVSAGELLLSFKLSIGQVSFAGMPMFTNEAIAAFAKNENIDLNFAYYALPYFIVENATENIYGAKILNQELIRSALFPQPSITEQTAIANFLDYETAKINSLIEEQVRLIELLNEKRQSIISNAVCRGLNPNVPFKNSGVEWLGMVPVHWAVEKIKNNILEISSGVSVNSIDTPALNGEVAVLKTSCVYSGEFDPLENKTVVIDEIERVSCPITKDTLVVSRMNTPELVGAAGLVREHYQNLFLPDRLWQISFTGLNPAFVHYWTLTSFYRAMVEISCAGTSSSMQNLTQEDFRDFSICFPNLDEQSSIVAHLDTEVNKLDELINESKSVVNLLNERRSALISAAVIGKIDVRNFHGY
jgi:type I restriction enzyme S subunit